MDLPWGDDPRVLPPKSPHYRGDSPTSLIRDKLLLAQGRQVKFYCVKLGKTDKIIIRREKAILVPAECPGSRPDRHPCKQSPNK